MFQETELKQKSRNKILKLRSQQNYNKLKRYDVVYLKSLIC